MTRTDAFKLAFAVVLLGIGGVLFYQYAARATPGEQAFFYDLSAGRLFKGPRDAAPPIRGVDGPAEDGFRALVISTDGHPDHRDAWKVAYLERFSPELQRATVEAQTTGQALAMGRLEAQANRFVRRLDDTAWHAMTTPEGEAIVNGWAQPGPDGVTPIVCAP